MATKNPGRIESLRSLGVTDEEVMDSLREELCLAGRRADRAERALRDALSRECNTECAVCRLRFHAGRADSAKEIECPRCSLRSMTERANVLDALVERTREFFNFAHHPDDLGDDHDTETCRMCLAADDIDSTLIGLAESEP